MKGCQWKGRMFLDRWRCSFSRTSVWDCEIHYEEEHRTRPFLLLFDGGCYSSVNLKLILSKTRVGWFTTYRQIHVFCIVYLLFQERRTQSLLKICWKQKCGRRVGPCKNFSKYRTRYCILNILYKYMKYRDKWYFVLQSIVWIQ